MLYKKKQAMVGFAYITKNNMENSFTLLAQYRKQARKAGVSAEQIDKVLKDATSGDREHLEEVLFEAITEIEND